MRRSLAFTPLLFAIHPVLHIFGHSLRIVGRIEGRGLLSLTYFIGVPIVIISAITILLTWLSTLLLKDNKKAEIFVSILAILFFFYGHFYTLGMDWRIGTFEFMRHRWLLSLWMVLIAMSFYLLLRTRKSVKNLVSIFKIVGISLITLSLVSIGTYTFQSMTWAVGMVKSREIFARSYQTENSANGNAPNTRGEEGKFRDIYYIICDRYPSERTLKRIYGFNNSEFLNFLKDRRFYVASESNSNYLNTIHSLASSLNLDYINHLTDKVGKDLSDWTPSLKMINDNEVQRFLQAKGYTYVHLGSWWPPTMANRFADRNINLFGTRPFIVGRFSNTRTLLEKTIFWYLNQKLGLIDMDLPWELFHHRNTLYVFDQLAEVSRMKEPTFAFAHILIPHRPFIFDLDGEFLDRETRETRTTVENFRNQVIFVNRELKKAIESILANSSTPPIIIVQADEGPFPPRYRDLDFAPDWEKVTDDEFQQKVGILNAYHLPGVDTSVLYLSMTPVNTFRLIFNLYFGTNLEMLPDKTYAHVHNNYPYRFFEITDRLKPPQGD